MSEKKEILAVGSIAFDTIHTIHGDRESILGGSATYFSVAASLFTKVSVIGIVGNDFSKSNWDIFKNNNVTFYTELKNTDKHQVFIDKSHLTRVLTNLIKNSLQAERAEAPIEVCVELAAKETNFVVRVTDNGMGIPVNIEDKIFEPNFTTKNSGMGLGLAIVKKIINDFHGTINYKTSNKGTIFEFKIPISNNKK